MYVASALELFTKIGISWLLRYAHVVVGIAWIGLLYYFNFVQAQAFAKMEAPHRNGAIDQLVPRALWYFRWAAAATAVTGILLYGINQNLKQYEGGNTNHSILTGMLIGLIMLTNVWMFIWPNQRIVIANARGLLAGKEADPAAATAGRRALLASRTNTFLSITMLMFMTGTQHFFGSPHFDANGGKVAIYWIITIVVLAAIEANALGYVQGLQGPGTKLLENYKLVIEAAVGLSVVFYLLWEIILRA